MKKTLNLKTILISLLICAIMICGFAGIGSLTAFAADGDACTVADCGGTYTNGFCSADDTHYEQPTTDSNGVYQIENAGNLYWFADKVNNDNTNYGSANAVLTVDITVNTGTVNAVNHDLRSWVPIGIEYGYNGTFDGNGHTISGLCMNRYFIEDYSFYGGVVNELNQSGVVKNLTVTNSYMQGRDSCGAVVGCNYGTVENCHSSNITMPYAQAVGGIVGRNYSEVKRCSSAGVNASAQDAGGIVGLSYGTVENCFSTGNISAFRVAGIVSCNYGTVENCYSTGTYTMNSDRGNQGGIVALQDDEATVENCYCLVLPVDNAVHAGAVQVTAEDMASGRIAYLLQGSQTTQVWGQDLDNGKPRQNVPVFSGAGVYAIDNCDASVAAVVYSNDEDKIIHADLQKKDKVDSTCAVTGMEAYYYCSGCEKYFSDEAGTTEVTEAELVIEKKAHAFDDNGFCAVCGAYQPAEQITAENYENYGFTTDNYSTYVNYYAITNAGQLYWFADKVDHDNTNYVSAKAVLTANIDLNSGYTFTFNPDTGLVEVKKDNTVVAYLGTGIKGDTSGTNNTFDETAAAMGAIYTDANDATADTVDLTGIRQWTPIGGIDSDYNTIAYAGTFDGKGHTVNGIYINGTEGYQGLFGSIGENGRVQNVTVANSYVKGDYCVGGVVGSSYNGTVENCYNTGSVSGSYHVGGVVGYNWFGTVANCYNTGVVSGHSHVGGVVGGNYGGTVTNCYNTGTVEGSYYVGGVVGYNSGTVKNCYNTGSVSGDSYVGGVVGSNSGTVANCYNTGSVSGGLYVGGVVGYNEGDVTYTYYLKGCATDGKDTEQNGIGNRTQGSATADVKDSTTGMTEEQFANGEVAYALYNWEGTINSVNYDGTVWGQDLKDSDDDTKFDAYPVFAAADGSNKVYETTACNGTTTIYTNDSELVGATAPHDFDDNGFCEVCGAYQPAVQITAENYAEYGFTTENYSTYVNYYAITNAGQLYWFADKVDHDNTNYGSANAVLTANIDLNPNYTFTFIPDTGLVEVKNNNNVVAYLGMGIKGDKSGNTVFDETASVAGAIYTDANDATADTVDLPGIHAWTPIGWYDSVNYDYFEYRGTFDGQEYTVSGIYINGTEYCQGLFGVVGENGRVQNVTVADSYVKGGDYVGGVVGYNNGTVTGCYNTGSVSGSYDVGGVVGDNFGTVTGCYNTGAVSGDTHVGGVAGKNDEGTVANCYNTGSVIGTSNSVGGVVGYNDGTVANCYYLIGTANGGINSADIDGSAEGKYTDAFASGEVAYKLSTWEGMTIGGVLYDGSVWGQNLDGEGDKDAYPVLDATKTVYYGYISCANNAAMEYTNDSTASAEKTHNYDKNGFCPNGCDGYQPAKLTTGKYDVDGDGEVDADVVVYEIENAGQLYWFADKNNNDNENYGSANAVLTANIDLNPGYSFTFIPDTGLVEVKKDSTVVAYLGMGIKGDTSGSDTAFDETASVAGKIYVYDAENDYIESAEALDSLNTWTPIGKSETYTGTFNGQGHTVSGIYINSTANFQGLFGVVGENGRVQNVTVADSYVKGDNFVGGVVGYNSGDITNCYNTGAVTGSRIVGGVVGQNYGGTVTNCYNTGAVSGDWQVGGVAGSNTGTGIVSNSYNTGTVSGSSNVGGVVGVNNSTVTNCYYLDTCGAGGSGVSKTDAQFASGEVAYILGSAWGQKIGEDAYPVLGGDTVYYDATNGYNNHVHEWKYTVDGNKISASCDAVGCANKDGGSVTLKAEDAFYTGKPIGATVEGSFTNGATYKITYDNDSETAPSSVGTHTAKLTVYENGTEKPSVTTEYEISYLKAPTPAYTILGGYQNGDTCWFKTGDTVTVKAPAGYKISTALDGTYGDSVSFSENDSKVIYLKRTSDGALTDAINIGGISFDGTGATGKITIENRGLWEMLLNKITFGLFFKGDAVAMVEATDEGSGVESIQYYVADEDLIGNENLNDATAISALEPAIGSNWNRYNNEITLNKNAKNVVYVKITDNVGNVTYLSSQGIVLYSDAEAVTESVSTTYKKGEDKIVTVKLNGNTVKDVVNGTTELNKDTDYTVSDGTITLKADYLDTLNAGTYTFTVSYNPLGETYVEVTGNDDPATTTFKVEIGKADGEVSNISNISKTYDGTAVTAPTFDKLGDGAPNIEYKVKGEDDSTYTTTAPINVGDYVVRVTVAEGTNHKEASATSEFTIHPKEVGIHWGPVNFLSYTGQIVLPEVTATGLVDGDTCNVNVSVVETSDGAGIEPGEWTAKITGLSNANYKLPENSNLLEVKYTIYASQEAPDVTGVAETVKGKNDGRISGLTTDMEYATVNRAYTRITDPNMDFVPGTYYVRYAAKEYYYFSTYTEVTVAEGGMLKVNVPATQNGYTLEAADSELVWNGDTTLTFALADGYSKTNDFAVKINGNKVDLDADNQYEITNAQENITVTVEGIADITAPTAEITLATNKWNTFLNSITFGLFFKETQSVTITAEDVNIGSGLDKIYYYLATEELTEDAVKALADADWTEYTDAFNIDPSKEYIIYAKAVDKAGNAIYVSSDGVVLDAIAPVINGMEDGGTYYGNTQFSVDESYIDTVTVDENKVDLTDGKYTITADGKEHTIVVTDKAGNDAKVKITVIVIATLDDTIENIKTTDVKSSDKEDIQEVLDLVNSLIDSGKDFTDEEDQQLSDIKSNAESLLEQIDDTAAETKDLTDKVDAYDETKVTSDDKQTITDLVAEIDELLEGDNLTEEEKEALGEVKADAEALIKKIDDAAAATDTDNTKKVKDVTAKTVTLEDKTDLEKAKADLEKALTDNSGNYTEDEKKAIENKIKKIDEALTVVENVEGTAGKINALPETVEPDDDTAIAAITEAKAAYDALTDYEKSLVDKETKAKLDKLTAAVVAYEIIKGDGSTWTQDSDSTITMTANGSYNKFVGIQVDGKDVDKANYEAKSGSTIITLKADYLNTLSVGEHKLTVLYTDGKTDGTFTVSAKASADNAVDIAGDSAAGNGSVPPTGDNSSLWMWIALLFISGGTVITLTVVDRKRRTGSKR